MFYSNWLYWGLKKLCALICLNQSWRLFMTSICWQFVVSIKSYPIILAELCTKCCSMATSLRGQANKLTRPFSTVSNLATAKMTTPHYLTDHLVNKVKNANNHIHPIKKSAQGPFSCLQSELIHYYGRRHAAETDITLLTVIYFPRGPLGEKKQTLCRFPPCFNQNCTFEETPWPLVFLSWG